MLTVARCTWRGSRAVGGRLKTDIRYSNTIVYNNFPVPPLAERVKEQLTARRCGCSTCASTTASRRSPSSTTRTRCPTTCAAAHAEVDALVDSIYSKRSYESDEQRLSDLFAMYEAMTAEEAAKAPAKKRSARSERIKKPGQRRRRDLRPDRRISAHRRDGHARDAAGVSRSATHSTC